MAAIERATYKVTEAAKLLGVSRDVAYADIRRDNALGGVPVIRVSTRIVIPAAPFDAMLGIRESQTNDDSEAA